MPDFIKRVRENVTEHVGCPQCNGGFDIEYNPHISGSFYHIITQDGQILREMSVIHTRKERSIKCPYCQARFTYQYRI